MSWEPSIEDITEAREQGDLTALLLMAAGLTPKAPRPRQAAEPEPICFHIRRPGAWPCGTAATGPTPQPCNECRASTTQEGIAA
ncbi:hypothetical protein ACFYPN_15895 [Streptomyces sp. NPDC005576]|uniref:hypothetical protein n=1 Tax=Streptomyces sp. NPDC005576 TaxID=3364726 RepID=UPI0036790577